AVNVTDAPATDGEPEVTTDVVVASVVTSSDTPVTASPPTEALTVWVPALEEETVDSNWPEELAFPAEGTAEPLVIDTVTAAPGTRLLNASRAVTVAVAEPPTPIDVGFRARVELAPDAAAGVTVMFRVCAIVTPSISAPTSLSPAAVWVYVAVATPLAVVGSGVVKERPPATATGRTRAPAIGFPLESLAVTVPVEPPAPGLPAVMLDGDTVSVDCEALTGPAVIVIWGDASVVRSEERRVGKECRCRWGRV